MSSPARAMQAAVYAALSGSAGLASAMGGTARVYDTVPGDVTWPYVRIGQTQTLDDSNGCADGFEHFETVHVWSRGPAARVDVKTIASEVRVALVSESLAPAGFDITVAEFESERVLVEPDGVTAHAIVEVRYLLDPA